MSDAPLDRSGLKQIYADVLFTARFHSSLDSVWWRRQFPHQSITAYAGPGWLFHNSNYFARPDNTGRALFRYVAHTDMNLYDNRVVLYGDVNMFTDRDARNKVSPTELDWIVGIAVRWRDFELSAYRKKTCRWTGTAWCKSIMPSRSAFHLISPNDDYFGDVVNGPCRLPGTAPVMCQLRGISLCPTMC